MSRFNKKFSSNIKALNEDRKKHLDKITNLCYNFHTEGKDIGYMKTIDPDELTKYHQDSGDRKGRLLALTERLLHVRAAVHKAYGRSVPRPVIAGGAVRDALLNLPARDYDAFVFFPEDVEVEDEFAVLSSHLRELYPETYTAPGHPPDPFFQYNGAAEFSVWNLQAMPYRPPLQLIHHPGKNSPEEVVGAFDHALVECYYDGAYHVSDNFLEALAKGRVPSKSVGAQTRLQMFRERTGYRITIGKPPKAVKSEAPESYAQSIYELSRQTNDVYLRRLLEVPRLVEVLQGFNPPGEQPLPTAPLPE